MCCSWNKTLYLHQAGGTTRTTLKERHLLISISLLIQKCPLNLQVPIYIQESKQQVLRSATLNHNLNSPMQTTSRWKSRSQPEHLKRCVVNYVAKSPWSLPMHTDERAGQICTLVHPDKTTIVLMAKTKSYAYTSEYELR